MKKQTQRCRVCTTELTPEMTICPGCGRELDPTIPTPKDTQERAPADDTMKCPHCQTEISAAATVCPNCTRDIKKAKSGYKTGTFVMALGLLIVLLGIVTDPVILVVGLALMGLGALVRITA